MYSFFAILVGGLVSSLVRILPLTLIKKPIKNRFLRSFLFYVPYVTLSVMTFPAILYATNSVYLGFIVLILGIVLSFLGMGLFPVAVFCCCAAFILQFFIPLKNAKNSVKMILESKNLSIIIFILLILILAGIIIFFLKKGTKMKINLKKIPCFGVAGNFTGHLEQAGEDKDFKNVSVKEQNEPKAIFPTYIPSKSKEVPDFLKIFPFDAKKILYPKNENKLQIESECAIVFDVGWENQKIKNLIPFAFAASNDCSIRKEGAKKISQKKNWGKSSKGFSKNAIYFSDFSENGILGDYRIASFLRRGNQIFEYGENSFVKNYNFVWQKLIDWAIEKFNSQKDEGPAENILNYLVNSKYKNKIMISIGATRYTDFGENNFLQKNDESIVILYPDSKFTESEIFKKVQNNDLKEKEISVLCQKICVL